VRVGGQKQVAAVAAVARTQRKQPRHSGTSAAKKAAARVESPAETARRQSNARLSEQAGQCLDRSVHFFHEIKAQLHPFISPRSYERLAQLRKSTRAPRAAATTLTETPACITHGAMRDYQLEGLSWLVSMHDLGVNQLIGDEMGLGKTLQTISLLGYLSSERNITGPHLIIVPLSVMSSWCSEFRKWCPSLRVVKLHSSSSAERERLKNEVLKDVRTFDVIVTTFEMAKSMENHLKRYWWQYLIVDEAHVLKNENSEISIVVSKLHSVQTMLLTGTPLQNNMHELWALLHVLHPKLFDDSVPFDKCFDLTHHISDEAMLAKAHLMMQHLMIRRVKSQVEVTVPDKEEMKIYCPLTDMQKYWTRKLLTHQADLIMTADKNLDAHGKGKKDTWKKLNNLLMQLRKVCNHPYQLPGAELDFDGGTDEDIVEGSGKLAMLDRMLPALQRNGHRCVIFSQFTSMLDILEDYIIMRGYDYARLDGSTNRVQRTVDIAMFNAKGSSKFIFLLSTRAGGLGVNLQTADTAILYDSDWNPQVDLQAMARVHRIGQTKKVHVYRFMTRGTVEERIVERAEKKLFLDRMVNRDSDDATMKMSSLDTKEVLSMLKFGAHAALNTDGDSEITSEEIDSIIDRTQTMDQKQSKLLTKKTQKNAADFNADEPFRAIRQFDGELVKPKPQSFRDIAREWSENNPKRARKSRLVSVHGHAVLQENNYSMSEGGISVMATSQSHADSMATVKNNTRQIAGKDYDHDSECFNCQDGGSLFCCSMCPASYHAACCGSDPEASWNWKCPQHNCAECGRTASSAGGTLFRCIACPTAYCEDHIPATAEIVGRSLRWEALGCKHQSQACYITCGSACVEFAKEDAKRRGQDLRLGVGGVTGLRAATGTRKDEAPAATAGSQDSEKKTAAVVDSTHTRAAIQECDLELFTKVCVRIPRQCKFDSAALVSVATTDGQRHRVELPADAKPGTDFNRWIPKVYNERTLPTLSELELKNWLISAGKEVVPNSNVLAQAVDVVVAKALDEKRTQEQAQKVQPSADVAKEVPRVTRRSPRGQQKKYSENALRERALRADDGAAAESGVLVVEVEIDGKTVHRVAPPSAPEGWTVHWDEASKQWFFWHDETESSTWELPACASTKPSAPPGWTVHWSVRSQRWFFWNADEKISIWQMPVSTELQGQEEQAKRMQEEEMQEQAQVEEEEEKGKVEEEEEEEEEEKAEESKKSGTDASVKSYRHYRPDRSNASSDGAIGQTGTMLTKMCINDPECQAWRLKECGISLHIARRIVAARSARPFKSARDLSTCSP
jgi:SWI/SNF-related matrix-associated actin-dependent regulator of chromatin subfamily A member 5